MLDANINQLRVNPAQMRTRIRVGLLAQLAVQVRHGLDRSLPLLARRDGDDLVVISGHRRWLARMIAHLSPGRSIGAMRDTIFDVCRGYVEDGWVVLSEPLYDHAVGLITDVELTIPVQVWAGSEQEEVLTLIRANAGPEAPDLQGQARAFHEALARGLSVQDLAQTAGLPEGMVQAILDSGDLPRVFQDLLNDELLDLSITPKLFELSPTQLTALARALEKHVEESQSKEKDYTGLIRLAITQLQYQPPIHDRKTTVPREYNSAYLLHALWQKAAKECPEHLWAAVSRRVLDYGNRINTAQRTLEILGQVPALDKYLIHQHGWVDRMGEQALDLLPEEASCSNCVFAQLPQNEYLADELEIFCREKGSFSQAGRCIDWAPEDQPFRYRTPYYWDPGYQELRSSAALLKAWAAQKEANKTKSKRLDKPSKPDIEAQRAAIRQFMEQHSQPPFILDHPWATACERCRHHLDKSPVKSAPDAPHCTWSKGRRTLVFDALVPDTEGEVKWALPWCRQFGPSAPWSELLPEEGEAPFSREVLVEMIRLLAKRISTDAYSTEYRAALQFLSGRPEKSSAKHRRTFGNAFENAVEELSDQQLWTLLRWLWLEWTRVSGLRRTQFVPIQGTEIECRYLRFSDALRWILPEPDSDE